MLDQVTEALAALETGGAFATELTLSSKDLKLEVDGVGPVRFPITASTARKLCAVTRPAPFGRGARTLHDRRVRDTGEIDESKIGIEGDAWDNVLAPQLAILQERLGLPADGTLEAVFDKMLVYGPGQFFATHQDSERDDTMIASLVVELPSAHEGGALVVEHRGKTQTFSRASLGPKELGLFAFYADCHHEVKPVTSGYRVTLSYQLLFRQGRASKKRKAPDANAIARLEASVKAYFATPVVPRYSTTAPQPPDRLVYLLD
ncbi:MAG: 2OG-Fe(II) oxygenase, partial [Minicystis sp.]